MARYSLQAEFRSQYQDFLDLTQYIILPQEKEVFQQLTTDRDRDIFIQSFWKQRDPTPGTPQNEYKEEHLKRFNYANRYLGRGSSREGWRTDQGRIHIILGEPASKERFEGSSDIYPTEVWSYYGDTSKGLPTHFVMVFFKRRGAGEFTLYDPSGDGPGSLIINPRGLDLTDYAQMYHHILEVAPTLAPSTLSMIPGEIPFNYQPSLESNLILSSIYKSPSKDINPGYASHFLSYRGLVSTEYMTNYVQCQTRVNVIPDPVLGMNFVHFSLVPDRVSVDYFEPKDQYFCNFKLTVSLQQADTIIFQYSRDLPIYFPPDDISRIQAHGISLEDTFPVIEGSYDLTVLAQNSVAKEFSLYEGPLELAADTGKPRIIGPILGPRLQNYQGGLHIPFKILDKKSIIDPKNTLAAEDDLSLQTVLQNVSKTLWEGSRLEIHIQGVQAPQPYTKKFSIDLREHPLRPLMSMTHTLPAREFPPDYYVLEMNWVDASGKSIDQAKGNFIRAPQESIPHPVANAKAFQLANSFLYHYMLASQYVKAGKIEEAAAAYERAYTQNAAYPRGVLDFARFTLQTGRYDRTLELLEALPPQEETRFEHHLLSGQAYLGKGLYDDALVRLLEANRIFNADTRLLNSLGLCFYRLGRHQEALEALRASLRLNPDQDDANELIKEIEKKL
jgi:GWxTD domain-containing protein